jgi:Xaa-Pro aminopeptidase
MSFIGYLLDPFARHALWRDGLDFRHGTGHGVGAFLNVHEGPHGIGTRTSYNDSPFAEGMTVTNGKLDFIFLRMDENQLSW